MNVSNEMHLILTLFKSNSQKLSGHKHLRFDLELQTLRGITVLSLCNSNIIKII